MPRTKTCPECGKPHTRHGIVCSFVCKGTRDARFQRERRHENVAAGAGPDSLPGSPAATPSTAQRRSTAQCHRGVPDFYGDTQCVTHSDTQPDTNPSSPDPLATAHASSLAIFHALPYVESITIHRDGHLYALRVGPPGESCVDVIKDLGKMEGAGKARGVPSLDFGGSR